MLQLLISALMAVAFGGLLCSSSPLPEVNERIVGGSDASIADVPYQLSLQYLGNHICGAVIIGPKHALTAAHCTVGFKAEDLKVRAGSIYHERDGEVVQVETVKQHPNYYNLTLDYDISVLILAQNLNFGYGIGQIELATENQVVAESAAAKVSGWGVVAEGDSGLSTQLKIVNVLIVGFEKCQSQLEKFSITNNMICAAVSSGGKDACSGDNGGPLVSDGVLVGLVSWGFGCARPNYPGVYTSIPQLRGFIDGIVSPTSLI